MRIDQPVNILVSKLKECQLKRDQKMDHGTKDDCSGADEGMKRGWNRNAEDPSACLIIATLHSVQHYQHPPSLHLIYLCALAGRLLAEREMIWPVLTVPCCSSVSSTDQAHQRPLRDILVLPAVERIDWDEVNKKLYQNIYKFWKRRTTVIERTWIMAKNNNNIIGLLWMVDWFIYTSLILSSSLG